jgi:tripartite-type tricarboxylate transporter receptor subunit TctC
MRSFFVSIIMAISTSVSASETITIRSPYDHNHAGNSALQSIIQVANQNQSEYKFVLISHPGGQGTVALSKVEPLKDIALIHPSFVQNSIAGTVKEKNWVPVGALGDACFLLLSQRGDSKEGIRSLKKSSGPFMMGVVGLGSAAHLVALEISSTIDVIIDPVMFKSAGEAILTMVAQDEMTMAMGTVTQFRTLSSKKGSVTPLAAFCPTRHPDLPGVSTMQEQGIKTPLIFNILVASVEMPKFKRDQISRIWDSASKAVGKDTIFAQSGFISPHFQNISIEDYYRQRVSDMHRALEKHKGKVIAK